MVSLSFASVSCDSRSSANFLWSSIAAVTERKLEANELKVFDNAPSASASGSPMGTKASDSLWSIVVRRPARQRSRNCPRERERSQSTSADALGKPESCWHTLSGEDVISMNWLSWTGLLGVASAPSPTIARSKFDGIEGFAKEISILGCTPSLSEFIVWLPKPGCESGAQRIGGRWDTTRWKVPEGQQSTTTSNEPKDVTWICMKISVCPRILLFPVRSYDGLHRSTLVEAKFSTRRSAPGYPLEEEFSIMISPFPINSYDDLHLATFWKRSFQLGTLLFLQIPMTICTWLLFGRVFSQFGSILFLPIPTTIRIRLLFERGVFN